MRVPPRMLFIIILLTSVVVCRMEAFGLTISDGQPAGAALLSLSGKPISGIDINITGPVKHTRAGYDMARTLIQMKPGDPLSLPHLERSLAYLNQCGRFEKVYVDINETGDSVPLTFHLTLNRTIRDIILKIDGRDGLFKQDVLNVMSIYPGKLFSRQEMERQTTIIEEMLNARGFPSPVVQVSFLEDADDDTVIIHVLIRPGPFYSIGSLTIEGNHAVSDFRLKSGMKTWRDSFFFGSSGRFVQRILDKDIEKMAHFYWKKGFPEARVNYNLAGGDRANTLRITVHVEEGPQYQIELAGNTEFWDRTLKKDVAIFKNSNRNDMGIRKSIKNIKDRYRNAGYAGVSITTEDETLQRGEQTVRRIRFNIHEGLKTTVRSIAIAGNTGVPAGEIRQQMLTRPASWRTAGNYVPDILADDGLAIQRLYEKKGYAHVRVDEKITMNDAGTWADIVMNIDEGPLVHVGSVAFEGLHAISETEALKALRLIPGAPLDPEMIQRDETELASLISENGYPHVTVKTAVALHDDGRVADIVHHIDEGGRVVMGDVFVAGNLRTKESIIQNEMEMTAGDPFSLTRMIQSQQNIRSMDIFKSVDFTPIGLKEGEEKVHLVVETMEKKPFFIELSGGYNSGQGGFGNATVGDHNLLGSNRDAYVSWGVSEIGYRGDAGIKSQRFFSTRVSSVVNVYTEKTEEFNQNFGVKAFGASFGISRKGSVHLSTGINLNMENREKYPVASGPADDGGYETRQTITVTPSIMYDTRDNFMIPTSGVLASLDMTSSHGINGNLDDFIKCQGNLRYYVPLFDKMTIAMIGRAGYIVPHDSSVQVSEDQLFFLGGISSVRGFSENMMVFNGDGSPVGGRMALSGSIEARLNLWDSMNVVVFYDAGRLSDTYIETDGKTRSSIGVGVGYQTPVGPISLYYGSKLDRKENESAGRFHFSIGYTF